MGSGERRASFFGEGKSRCGQYWMPAAAAAAANCVYASPGHMHTQSAGTSNRTAVPLSCFPPPPPVLQLLMGASDFCGFMHALAVLAPGVDGK
jgi:hypothetical protein